MAERSVRPMSNASRSPSAKRSHRIFFDAPDGLQKYQHFPNPTESPFDGAFATRTLCSGSFDTSR